MGDTTYGNEPDAANDACRWLFAKFEARAKSGHTKPKCAAASCVHGVDHTPSAGSACSCCGSLRSCRWWSAVADHGRADGTNASMALRAVVAALGRSGSLVPSASKAPLWRALPLGDRTTCSRPVSRQALPATRESVGAMPNARFTRRPAVERPTSASVCAAS